MAAYTHLYVLFPLKFSCFSAFLAFSLSGPPASKFALRPRFGSACTSSPTQPNLTPGLPNPTLPNSTQYPAALIPITTTHYLRPTAFDWGFVGAALARGVVQWLLVILTLFYMRVTGEGSSTWGGFTAEAFEGWGDFLGLAIPGLVMYVPDPSSLSGCLCVAPMPRQVVQECAGSSPLCSVGFSCAAAALRYYVAFFSVHSFAARPWSCQVTQRCGRVR